MTGPADASHFQSTNRYRQRGYTDNLPPCPLNPEPSGEWVPGFTSLKPSKPFYKKHTNGTAYRMDVLTAATWAAGKAMPDDVGMVADRFTEAIDAGFAEATGRGTDAHNYAEQVLQGYEPDPAFFPAAEAYLGSIRACITDLAITPIALEVVVFGDGWAGTADGFATVDGRVCVIDWKTRSGRHATYEEEACQLGAYSSASYMIVEHDGVAVRRPVPIAEAGLVLSITEDSYAAYAIDLAEAQAAFAAMHASHEHKRTFGFHARKAIRREPIATGEPTAPNPLTAPAEPTEDELVARCGQLRDRVTAIITHGQGAPEALVAHWPTGCTTLKENPQPRPLWRIESIERALAKVETDFSVPFGAEVDGTFAPDHPRVAALGERFAALPADLVAEVTRRAMTPGPGDDWAPVPNLRFNSSTHADLTVVEELLTAAETARDARRAEVAAEAAALGSEGDWAAVVAATSTDIGPEMWTADDLTHCLGILQAIAAGVLTIEDGTVTATDEAVDALVSVAGAKRQVNARAKDHATALGRPVPRSAADVVDDPVVTGLIVAEATGASAA